MSARNLKKRHVYTLESLLFLALLHWNEAIEFLNIVQRKSVSADGDRQVSKIRTKYVFNVNGEGFRT